MINNKQRQLIHQFILVDMAQRSIKNDIELYEKYKDHLKMTKIYLKIINDISESLHQEYYNIKRLLSLNKISVGKWKHINDKYSNIHYLLRGIEGTIMHNNEQLKSEVEDMLIQKM